MSLKTSLSKEKAIYVVNDDKLMYRMYQYESFNYDDADAIQLYFELVAGWDYINPDYSDAIGWCKPDRFIEDVQDDWLSCYIFDESIKHCIEDNGYEIIDISDVPDFVFED